MVNDQPQVTVVTLTYRHFESVYKTIDSVLAQDYPNIQYIICDDGSADFPGEELHAYFDNKDVKAEVQIEHSAENRGTVKNINHAYKLATGKYVMNLSCGDVFFDSTVISRVVSAFEEKKCDVLVTSRILYQNDFEPLFFLPHYSDRKRIESWKTPEKQRKAFVTSSFLDMASGSAMYFNREAIKNMGYFDEKYVLWEDGPFINRYLLSGKIECAYDIVSIWYETGGVSTGSGPKHPLMIADEVKFNSEDRLIGTEKYSAWNRAKIRYRNASLLCKDSGERRKLKIRYFPVFVYYSIQYMRGKMAQKRDKKVIQSMLGPKA